MISTVQLLQEEEENELMAVCAQNIVKHLERNIIKNRQNPSTASKYAQMNKYIQVQYLSGTSTIQ